jgi:hypothetical protein
MRLNVLPYAGLIVGPAWWALDTQLGQILPYPSCSTSLPLLALPAFLGMVVAFAAAVVSFKAPEPVTEGDRRAAQAPRSLDFIRLLAGMTSLVFAFALLLQGTATLVLSGCER